MHPLLTPSTHADLEIAARNLVGSGYYAKGGKDECFTKMLMGVTLGLTILESVHGVLIDSGKVILPRQLVERVIKRAGITITVDQVEGGTSITFSKSGRKIGSISVANNAAPTTEGVYELALIRGVREHLMDVFAHKFYLPIEVTAEPIRSNIGPSAEHPLLPQLRADLAKKSRVEVLTADKLTVPKHPHKLALAQDSQTLLDWKNKLPTLGAEDPSEWDSILGELNAFTFLTDAQKDGLFNELLQLGAAYGVDYNDNTAQFFLAEVPQLTE